MISKPKISVFCDLNLLIVNSIIGIGALGFSMFITLGTSTPPCKFCKIQQILFFLIFLTSIISIFFPSKKIMKLILISFCLIGVAITLYHIFIQYGIITDPCSISFSTSFDIFKEKLLNNTLSCSKITRLFGVPLPIFSILGFLLSLIISYKLPIENSPSPSIKT